MDISIVTTMYYSSPYLKEFYRRIKVEVEKVTDNYEIIFVNDGSPDDSLEVAVSIYEENSKIRVVDLSRNFGHHKAMMTGLSYAKGEKIFLIDCDLEEEPELFSLFYQQLLDRNCDVVYGVQKIRKGGIFEQLSGAFFYRLLSYLADVDLPQNIVTARLMSRKYVKSLLRFREREVFLAGVWHITGYEQVPMYVVKHSKSETTYSFSKKMNILVNAVTSFSNKPLIYIFYIGLFMALISAIFILDLVRRKLLFNTTLVGWTSLIVSIWFIGGLIICFLGVIGMYISKIFIETKNRPYTIVRQLYQRLEKHEQ
ncbi:glycosyltransferase family 2 protein [Coleofasciculus sp. FACHB-T130]|uniref:glycosyltransferase family 2 protein n=1 Tax=Cyanophyceae TaxID=3028117 RepID=UPI00168986E3|nr:glycosyltransferase family 2 protein [Coleofasciculus sp. FACHB-T130]MBD1878320.1 glycosyltransferase family 2 protein [Coleofasciculus sp. FACHB-T130]